MSCPEQLKAEHQDIHQRIFEIARRNKLSNDDIEPIPDGIYDTEKYLDSKQKSCGY